MPDQGTKATDYFIPQIFPFIPKYSHYFPLQTQSVDILFPKCPKNARNK
jgi:hypothetical protein